MLVSDIAAYLWLSSSIPCSNPSPFLPAQSPAYLVNGEVPGGFNYVFPGAGEDGNVMVEDFGGIRERGGDLEVEAVCGI